MFSLQVFGVCGGIVQCSLGFLLFLITVLYWRRDADRCESLIKKKSL